MNILGISAGFHDAAVAVLSDSGEIRFASHSERYSKNKHDTDLCDAILDDIDQYTIGQIAYYERPWARQLRQLWAGQGIDWDQLTVKEILRQQTGTRFRGVKARGYNHHLCHAAADCCTQTRTMTWAGLNA